MWDAGRVMVPPESPIVGPEQLAGQEIAVGYHSGSHYTTIQSLEPYLTAEQTKLRFGGSIWARVDIAVGRGLPAVSVWGLSFQVLEQLGFRKVVDATFMIAFMFPAYGRSGRRRETHERHEAGADGPRFHAGEVSALLSQ